jgi:hypothetical protein
VRSAARKIHAAVFAIENRREAYTIFTLRSWPDGCIGKAGESFNNERRSFARQDLKQFGGCLVWWNFNGLLQQDWPRVQSLFQKHGCVAGVRIAHCNCPLDRRGATVFRQQRRVQIDAAMLRQRKHPRRQNAAVGYYYDCFGSDGFELRLKFTVMANLFGLHNCEACGKRRLFYWRRGQLLRTAYWTVGLGNYQRDFVACGQQSFKRWNSEAWRAAKDEFHRVTIRLRLASFLFFSGSGCA